MNHEAEPPKVDYPKLLILLVVAAIFALAAPSCGCARPKHPDRLRELNGF